MIDRGVRLVRTRTPNTKTKNTKISLPLKKYYFNSKILVAKVSCSGQWILALFGNQKQLTKVWVNFGKQSSIPKTKNQKHFSAAKLASEQTMDSALTRTHTTFEAPP